VPEFFRKLPDNLKIGLCVEALDGRQDDKAIAAALCRVGPERFAEFENWRFTDLTKG
jgi:hypothetical protein